MKEQVINVLGSAFNMLQIGKFKVTGAEAHDLGQIINDLKVLLNAINDDQLIIAEAVEEEPNETE